MVSRLQPTNTQKHNNIHTHTHLQSGGKQVEQLRYKLFIHTFIKLQYETPTTDREAERKQKSLKELSRRNELIDRILAFSNNSVNTDYDSNLNQRSIFVKLDNAARLFRV